MAGARLSRVSRARGCLYWWSCSSSTRVRGIGERPGQSVSSPLSLCGFHFVIPAFAVGGGPHNGGGGVLLLAALPVLLLTLVATGQRCVAQYQSLSTTSARMKLAEECLTKSSRDARRTCQSRVSPSRAHSWAPGRIVAPSTLTLYGTTGRPASFRLHSR